MRKTRNLLLCLVVALSLSACNDAGENGARATVQNKPEKPAETTMSTESEQKNRVTFFIAPTQADCMGVAPQKCLQVKQKKDEDWSLFYSTIEGFDFEDGYHYEIIVETEKIVNPPMDRSSLRYILVNIVSKEPAK